MIEDKLIFINISPEVFCDYRFQIVNNINIMPHLQDQRKNIVFEISEKTKIEDYASFHRALNHHRNQGRRIALDDTGAGYSGLQVLAQTRPNFIKVDMELIRDIDHNHVKQTMLKVLHDFAGRTNAQVIAEGIETMSELSTIIQLGIPYGQGFLLHKPTAGFSEISTELRDYISSRHQQEKRKQLQISLIMCCLITYTENYMQIKIILNI